MCSWCVLKLCIAIFDFWEVWGLAVKKSLVHLLFGGQISVIDSVFSLLAGGVMMIFAVICYS